jgi:hypothetical protein
VTPPGGTRFLAISTGPGERGGGAFLYDDNTINDFDLTTIARTITYDFGNSPAVSIRSVPGSSPVFSVDLAASTERTRRHVRAHAHLDLVAHRRGTAGKLSLRSASIYSS